MAEQEPCGIWGYIRRRRVYVLVAQLGTLFVQLGIAREGSFEGSTNSCGCLKKKQRRMEYVSPLCQLSMGVESMNPMLTICPVCKERLSVTRLHCRGCDITIDGYFGMGRLGRLSEEQLAFIETFISCEGKLSRMEPELGMSYPTLRARLLDVIRTMGFTIGSESPRITDEERHRILDDLASGKLTSEEAVILLEGD
jgi:hypothetical protein